VIEVCRRFSSWVGLVLVSFFLSAGHAMAQGTPLTATLTTDRGCGGSATYQNGETIRVRYSVSQNAIVTITLTRPDGFVLRPVFQQPVPAGVTQEYVGTVGGVSGPRQLFLDATSTTVGTASVECIYFGTGGPTTPPPPPPPPPPGQLTASLITNRGCGPTAIFAKGELSEFRYQVSQSALVTLRLQRPDGTVSTLLLNQPAAGGVTYVFRGVIGDPPGQRLLTLNAVAGTLSAQVQCTYTGQSVPAPSPLSLTVDRGCGASYRVGEGVTIRFQSPVNASLTLLLQLPDGTSRVVFANRLALGGTTYAITGIAGTPVGQRTLTLRASGSTAADATCNFTVTP
jgi:hypothetical protein